MTSAQIIISVLIISLIIKTSLVYIKRRNLPVIFFIAWIFFWISSLIIVNNLPILTIFSKIVGVGRGVDLAVYISIIIIFYLIFFLISENYSLKKQITHIVRHLAISEYEKKKTGEIKKYKV